jgi:hypothetical protein
MAEELLRGTGSSALEYILLWARLAPETFDLGHGSLPCCSAPLSSPLRGWAAAHDHFVRSTKAFAAALYRATRPERTYPTKAFGMASGIPFLIKIPCLHLQTNIPSAFDGGSTPIYTKSRG